jgi:deoxyribonuclease V
MLAAVDVQYDAHQAIAACVTFEHWTDAEPWSELVAPADHVQDYVPGQFWRRELPCILAALRLIETLPDVVLVDGHVWLDAHGRKGLGAHLYDALEGRTAVIGVAKNPFRGLTCHSEVFRGKSHLPLWVTSVGFDGDAAGVIAGMHGRYRMPTLLKRADQLCRLELKRRSEDLEPGR